jgi:hypothetical protein
MMAVDVAKDENTRIALESLAQAKMQTALLKEILAATEGNHGQLADIAFRLETLEERSR